MSSKSAKKKKVTIALDAMGGDRAPQAIVLGAELARQRHPGIRFKFFGDKEKLNQAFRKVKPLQEVSTIHHCDEMVDDDMKPSVALRQAQSSSMRLAIDAVRDGEADCVVSAGNTGALMAMAKFVLKTIPGIDRPAIVSFFPTSRGQSVLLDLGANIDCKEENLVQFALMGALFSRTVLGVLQPSVGLLNVGSEVLKGNKIVQNAAQRLGEMTLPGSFYGFVEGNDIPAGTVDVVVTDGFSGNVVLKAAEGTAKLNGQWLKQSFRSSISARIGYLFAYRALRKLAQRIDPRKYNGAVFLGLQGICIKSHGGSDAFGFANALDMAIDLAAHNFNAELIEEFEKYKGSLSV